MLGIKKSAEELGFEEYYRLSFDDLATADDDNETERLTRYKTLVCMQTPKEEVEKKEAENHVIITSIDTASPSLSAFPESGQKYQYALKDNSSYSQVQVFNPVSSKKAKYDPTASSIGHERSSRGVIKVKRCKGDKSSAGSTLWRILCCAISSS